MTNIWNFTELASGDLRLVCLPGVGGRLWDVVFEGQSLLFQNPDLTGIRFDLGSLTDLPTRSPQFAFPLWGGEKTWIAPDAAWPNGGPHPVLDSGPYKVTSASDRHIALQSAQCPLSGLRIERRISLDSPRDWSLHHRVQNLGSIERFVGIWSVLMLNRPARIGVYIGSDAAVLPVFGDASHQFEIHDGRAVIDCSAAREFKLGMQNPEGRALLRLNSGPNVIWLECRTTAIHANDQFAHGHNFEVFNSADYAYCEAEWHAPGKRLAHAESMSFEQKFTVWSDINELDADEIESQKMELIKCMS